MLNVNFKLVKAQFFDRKVVNELDVKTRQVFSKFGAYVRQRAKRSIRKRQSSSPPDAPPSSHTGLLKRFIFFSYDRQQRSVIIGPVRLQGQTQGEAPSLLEHGGVTTIVRRKKRKQIPIQPRPFMAPAFEAEQKQLPAMWKK